MDWIESPIDFIGDFDDALVLGFSSWTSSPLFWRSKSISLERFDGRRCHIDVHTLALVGGADGRGEGRRGASSPNLSLHLTFLCLVDHDQPDRRFREEISLLLADGPLAPFTGTLDMVL